jgi:hypothetical protein
MASTNPHRNEVTLHYPGHLPHPEDLLSFVESNAFRRGWERCRLNDNDLMQLQLLIMLHPKGNPVVKGAGGIRKIRFSPDGSSHGKSGSHRALYMYYEDYGVVLLAVVYPKSKKDDLSAAGLKAVRQLADEQFKLLKERGQIQ